VFQLGKKKKKKKEGKKKTASKGSRAVTMGLLAKLKSVGRTGDHRHQVRYLSTANDR